MEEIIKENEKFEQERLNYMLSHKTEKRYVVIHVEKFEIQGRTIKLYYRLKKDEKFIIATNELADFCCHIESFAGVSLDATGKYIIISFLLRSFEDIAPYIETSENSIPKQKIQDKIKKIEMTIQEFSDEQGYYGSGALLTKLELLQELLEEENKNE